MGFFGTLLGWDQCMGAINAVLASHLIENSDRALRQKIAREVVTIIASVRKHQTLDSVLDDIGNQSRVVQMNFIALACDNLSIAPTVPNNVWARVKNPYHIGQQVDANRISVAVDLMLKEDGVRVAWPGDNVRIDFVKMHNEGLLGYQSERAASSKPPSLQQPPDTEEIKNERLASKYRELILCGHTFVIENSNVIATTPSGRRQLVLSQYDLNYMLGDTPAQNNGAAFAVSADADIERISKELALQTNPVFPDVPWAKNEFQALKYRKLIAYGYSFVFQGAQVVATTPTGGRQVIHSVLNLSKLIEDAEKDVPVTNASDMDPAEWNKLLARLIPDDKAIVLTIRQWDDGPWLSRSFKAREAARAYFNAVPVRGRYETESQIIRAIESDAEVLVDALYDAGVKPLDSELGHDKSAVVAKLMARQGAAGSHAR